MVQDKSFPFLKLNQKECIFASQHFELMKLKSDRNKTLTLNNEEASYLETKLIQVEKPVDYQEIMNKTIWGDSLETLRFLPSAFVDLAIIDPPYNLDKDFGELKFSKMAKVLYR